MAIFGIGIDLVEVSRIKTAIEKYGERFKKRIFSASEQSFCESRNGKYLSYAARFASKEAFSKALGTGLRGKISWLDINVVDNEYSPPRLEISGRAQKILGNRKTLLSITHTESYASAVVLIEE
ncbi:MAG: holo-ACP synthase [Candidatus Latescibacteria bacterium]|nr:holo-ACP synthase [Candidatus Latescibacterota bacterium]